MKYSSDIPTVETHKVFLDREDIENAIWADISEHPSTCDKAYGVDKDYSVSFEFKKNGDCEVVWQTEVRRDAQIQQQTRKREEKTTNDKENTTHRSGKFAVVKDSGDRARTGDIAATFDTYEKADEFRYENSTIADRASIVFVVKSGSRYLPDMRTYARDDEDEDDNE